MSPETRSDVAVFIDFENVYVSVRDKLDANPNFESIMDRCSDLGRVVIARAYADWYRYPRVTSALFANGVEPIYVPTYYYDRDRGRTGGAIKNSVDIHLCIDMMKTLYTNANIEKFVLVTGDRDFIPLVNSVRQHGKEVVVIGIGGAASSHLAQSADEFIFYETLIGKPTGAPIDDRPRARMPEKVRSMEVEPELEAVPAGSPAPAPREPRNGRERERREPRAVTPPPAGPPAPPPAEVDPNEVIYDTLVEAIQLARKRGYVGTLGSLKLLMKELMGGDFKESRYRDSNGRPFAKFKDFVQEAERRGKVQIFTSGTVNEVFLPSEDPYKLSQFAVDLEKEVAPAPPPPPVEEPRAAAPVAGRRRRRRSRSQRAADAALGTAPIFDLPEPEDLFGDIPGYAAGEGPVLAGDQAALPELPDLDEISLYTLIDDQLVEPLDLNLVPPRLDEVGGPIHDAVADAPEADMYVERPDFEGDHPPVELLASDDSVPESDHLRGEYADEALPEPEVPVAEAGAGEPSAEAAEEAGADDAGSGAAVLFADDEWALFYEIMAGFTKPVSFQQIFNSLREARLQGRLSLQNEQLRTMAKQAINGGMLERSGKGNRVYYRLKPVA